MKKKHIIIAILVLVIAYYYYYTFMKPCKCNCANGGTCKCKKNLILKAFDKINETVGVKRKGCTQSSTPLPATTTNVPLTEDPTAGCEEINGTDIPVMDSVMNEAQSKTNDEVIFAEQQLNIAKGERQRLEASQKVDAIIRRLEKKLDEQMCLRKNLADDPRMNNTDVTQIQSKCSLEIKKLTTQIRLLRGMKSEILDTNGYENVGYGIYVLKGVMHPESVHKVYNHLLDRSEDKKNWTILCKKEDIANIGLVVPCENIVDLYWNEFVPTR